GERVDRRARRGDDRPDVALRDALAAVDDAAAEAQLRFARKAEGLGRPERRGVARHIVEAGDGFGLELGIAVVGEQFEIAGQRVARLDLETLGVEDARLAGRTAGAVQDAVTLLDLESVGRNQRVRGRLPLHARLILRAGLWPVGRDRSAVDILNRTCDRQEAFGIAEEGREARADLSDDAGAAGGGIVLLARRAGG